MSDGSAILLSAASTFVGWVLGSVSSWYFSRWYYRRSGSDLAAVAQLLLGNHSKTLQVLYAFGHILELNGLGTFSRDGTGTITGIALTATGHAKSSSQPTAVGRETYSPPPQYDRQHEQPPSPKSEGNHA